VKPKGTRVYRLKETGVDYNYSGVVSGAEAGNWHVWVRVDGNKPGIATETKDYSLFNVQIWGQVKASVRNAYERMKASASRTISARTRRGGKRRRKHITKRRRKHITKRRRSKQRSKRR